jgi:thymidylate kinase
MSIIIFEGTDHCGKTSIAKAFCERNPSFKYFKVKQEQLHIEKVDPEILKQSHLMQLNFFYEFARQIDFNVVMDRFFPSEFVYGKLFRDIDETEIMKFDELFASIGTVIIIVEKADDKLEDRLWTKAQLLAIKERYSKFVDESKCRVLYLNTDSEDLEWELNEIHDFINSKIEKRYVKK